MNRVQSANIKYQHNQSNKNIITKTDSSPLYNKKTSNSLQISTVNNQKITSKSTYNTNRYSGKNKSQISFNPTNNSQILYNNESQKSIPLQNQEHVYFLSERPSTASSYKFLFLTETDSNSAKFVKQQELEKKIIKNKSYKPKTESEKLKEEIRNVNNVLQQNKDYSKLTPAQKYGFQRNRNQTQIEQQWSYFLSLKNTISDTYQKDFQDYIEKQSNKKDMNLQLQDENIMQVQQAREEKFRILRNDYKKNMEQQKIQLHNYLAGKQVNQHLINNYKNILHPQSCKVLDHKPSYKKNQKEFQINSQVHRKLKLPGYRENKVASKSTNKVKIKQFLHNYMQGEQQYFNKLKSIQQEGETHTVNTLKLKDKFYEDYMYEPNKFYQNAEDLQLGSKDCKLLQEQAQVQQDLKQFQQKINYKTNQIEVEPKSPQHYSARNQNQTKTQILQRQQTKYSEHNKQGIVDYNNKQNKKISHLFSLTQKNKDLKNQQLNMIKAFMQKHKQFSQKYLIFSEEIEEIDRANEIIDRQYFNDQLNQMIMESEDVLDVLNGKKQVFQENCELTDKQKEFLFYVKNNYYEEAQVLLFYDKKLLEVKDKLGQTPLHYAAKRGYIDMVDLLLKNGAGIGNKDHQQRSAKDVCLRAQGKKSKIYINLDRLEHDLYSKRHQILESAMIDLNRLNKWVENSKQNSKRNYEMSQDCLNSSSSDSELEEFIEQPLRQKLMEQY